MDSDPTRSPLDPESIPRCDELDGSSLRIVRSYTEAGRFCEANCVTITDGERTCVYVPLTVADPKDFAYCCMIGCHRPAEWQIESAGSLHTHACTAHVGELLTDGPEHRLTPIR